MISVAVLVVAVGIWATRRSLYPRCACGAPLLRQDRSAPAHLRSCPARETFPEPERSHFRGVAE